MAHPRPFWERLNDEFPFGDPAPVPTLPPELLALGPYHSIESLEPFHGRGQRLELVDGELLVTWRVTLEHQRLLGKLLIALSDYAEEDPALYAIMNVWAQAPPDTLVLPDILVLPRAIARTDDPWPLSALCFVAEVIDPDSVRADRFTKRARYQRAGIGTCWVVDPRREVVEAWTPGAAAPVEMHQEARWRAPGRDHDLVVDLPALFHPRA